MNLDIITRRLSNQGLSEPRFETPAEAVGWLGAVQSQDYPGAKWALGQRMAGASDSALDRAFDAGEILRTHVLRPTWHFIRPEDIRWMLALTGPRVLKATRSYFRRFGLEDDEFRRAAKVIERALIGGQSLTRADLVERLRAAGFDVEDHLRATYLALWAELSGLIVSGPRQGNPAAPLNGAQSGTVGARPRRADAGHNRGGSSPRVNRGGNHTFALLDERVPQSPILSREESLSELARRFFTSHGPATLKDYAWWSGLTAADARLGIAASSSALAEEIIDGVSYWSGGETIPSGGETAQPAYRALLLPNYDEYVVAYAGRGDIIDDEALHRLDPRGNLLFSHTLLLDGRVIGTWKRTFRKGAALVELATLAPLSAEQSAAVESALARYGGFLGMPVELMEASA